MSLRRVWPVTAVAWLAALLVLALAGCGAPAAGQRDPGRAEPKGHAVWLLTRMALSQVSADPAVRTALAREQVYEILQPGQQPLLA